MSTSNDEERDRLHGYIAGSRRVQRRLAMALVALVAVSLAVLAFSRPIGGLLLLGTAIVGVCGFWVTAAHIADWRLRLRTLDQRRTPSRVWIRQGRGR